MKSISKPRRVKRPSLGRVEDLETRQLLTTIFTEGFEGVWPGTGWTTSASQGHVWDDTSNKSHSLSYSAFCSDLADGTNQTTYEAGMNTTMTRTIDLSDFRDVSLSYWRFVNTEAGFDKLQVTVSKAGAGSVQSAFLSGNHQTWTQDTLQIPESLWGQSNVKVEFKFISDGTFKPAGNAGVWIDDILMEGTEDVGFPESTITPLTGVNLRLNQFGNISGITGNIGSAAEQNVYGFGVDSPGDYTITITGALDAQVRVYDAAGNAITGIKDGTGANGTETITVNRGVTGQACYFVVSGYKNTTGNYSVAVNGPSTSPSSNTVSSPDYSFTDSSSIDYAGDRDYFSFVAPLDTTSLTITLDPTVNLDPYLTLLDANGNVLTTRDNGGTGVTETLSNFNITPGQTYVLMVSGYSLSEGSAASEGYTYTIDFGPDNVGNPPSKITVPDGTNLRLNQFGDISGVANNIDATLDTDTFGFGVETSGNYTISANGAVDVQLRVYDSNGNEITGILDATGGGGSESVIVNLIAGQTCYFVIGGYNTTTGNYTVSVNGPSATVPAAPISGPNFFVADSATFNYAGDRDYFGLTAPAGTNVLSIIMNPSANLDGVFSLFDAQGNLLQQRDSSGTGGSEALTNFAVTPGTSYVLMFSGYNLTEGANGTEGYSYSIDFGPDLADVNVAPSIPAGQDLPVAENSPAGTVVGTVVANDANSTAPNNVLTYSIVSGSPSNPFTINPSTGLVTYVGPGALNFENIPEYTLTVKVTDGGNLFTTQQVKISVSDVNETPSIPAGQSHQVLENSAIGTVVGTVLADDPDTSAPNDTLTYSIVSGNPNNPFSIDSVTGEITVANPAALDFETTSQFVLQVKVTDGGNGNLNATQSVVINLVDANDGPSIDAGQTFSVPENSAQGTSVGTVQASDPDTTAPNNTLTYSITGGNSATAFAINPTTGEITVNNTAALDFENVPSYTLNITVTDGGAFSASQDVIVNLTNVNEAPTLGGAPIGSPTFVFKNKTAVSVFPSISVKDPDGDTELASVTVKVSIPTGTKNFDVIGFAGAAGLGTVSDTIVGGKRTLTITLNNGVTSSQVETFLRSITFATSKKSLKTTARTFEVSVTDIHGATSNLVTQSVNVKKKP